MRAFHSADGRKNAEEPAADNLIGDRPRAVWAFSGTCAGQFWTQANTRLAVALDSRREPFLRLLFSIPLTVRFVEREFAADERGQMLHGLRGCCQMIQQRATCRLFPAGVDADSPDAGGKACKAAA